MNNITELPSKISVKLSKESDGTFIAELFELNTHVEANNEFELIKLVNNAIKLYFDLSEDTPIIYAPPEMFGHSVANHQSPTDFLKYLPSNLSSCHC